MSDWRIVSFSGWFCLYNDYRVGVVLVAPHSSNNWNMACDSTVFGSQVMRIKWEIVPNPDCRTIHVDDPLFNHFKCDSLENLEGSQKELVVNLKSILGISDVSVWPYRIHITKAKVFDWKEVDSKVEDILSNWMGEEITERQTPHDWSNAKFDD